MKHIWTYIDTRNWKAASKYRAVMMIFGTLSAALGFALWLMIRSFMLSTWDWMLCFIGYPIIFSGLAIFFYSCNHAFHDGNGKD